MKTLVANLKVVSDDRTYFVEVDVSAGIAPADYGCDEAVTRAALDRAARRVFPRSRAYVTSMKQISRELRGIEHLRPKAAARRRRKK